MYLICINVSAAQRIVYPPAKIYPCILSPSANDVKTYISILWCGSGYRKSEIMDFVKTGNW